jgi:orotate phosphoribosyltransferase
MDPNRAANLAKFLLEINAVKLNPDNPFTWTSGIQSPIYCDNRMVLSFPEVRTFVKQALKEITMKHFPQTEMIAGIATAGIAHAALLADTMELPNCYVRPEPKKHGMKNQIEGNLPPGSKVLLVEDLISTGKSSLQAADAVREAGSEVIGLVALFTYGFADAKARFADAGVDFHTISDFETLADVAVKNGYLSPEKVALVKAFAHDPQNWKAI